MSTRDGASRAIALLTAGHLEDNVLDDEDFLFSLIGETDDEVAETVAALRGIALAAMDAATNNNSIEWLQGLALNIDKLPDND